MSGFYKDDLKYKLEKAKEELLYWSCSSNYHEGISSHMEDLEVEINLLQKKGVRDESK